MTFAKACAEAGVDFLDAPVSGGRMDGEARTLTTMVGGPEVVAQRCEALFQTFSTHVLYLGGHGSGELAKLFNNTLMMNQANILDIINLATRVGVDPITLVEVIKLGSGSSTSLQLIPVRSPVSIDAAVVEHATAALLLDMELFQAAMNQLHVDAEMISARAIRGASRVPELVRTLNP